MKFGFGSIFGEKDRFDSTFLSNEAKKIHRIDCKLKKCFGFLCKVKDIQVKSISKIDQYFLNIRN